MSLRQLNNPVWDNERREKKEIVHLNRPGVKSRKGLFSLMINRDNWGNLYFYSSGEMQRQ